LLKKRSMRSRSLLAICVMWDLDFAGALGGDDSRGFGVADEFAQSLGVIDFIRDNTGRCTAARRSAAVVLS